MASTASKDEELNPLAPCGAGKEWLRRIAEVNPDFWVLTFTSVACTDVYVDEVH